MIYFARQKILVLLQIADKKVGKTLGSISGSDDWENLAFICA